MDEASQELTIAELARRAGVTPRTIRYYVAEGLLPPPGRRGQRRCYTIGHLVRLAAIKRLKEAFLPLAEIRHRLSGLSEAELERLARLGVRAPADDLLAELPARTTAPRPPGSALAGPLAFQGSPSLGRFGSVHDETPPSTTLQRTSAGQPVAGAGDVWHRVTLAPGVELHYQVSGDRRRDEAIAHIVRAAMSILSSTGVG